MTNTITRTLSPRMTEMLIAVAKGDDLSGFRNITMLALLNRGYLDISEWDSTTGDASLELTLSGQMYLSTYGYAVFAEDRTIVKVSDKPMSVLETRRILREYYVNVALKSEDSAFTGKLREVSDELNNVGRRCSIKGNGDTETRCWEILAQVNYVKSPVSETIYLCRYVGNEWSRMYENSLSGVYLCLHTDLTNLY